MLVLPKPPKWLKKTVLKGALVVIEKNSNLRLKHWFSKCYLFCEFRMKYFKDIEILYEKFYIISKYCPISKSNVDTVITDMNNIELSSDSDSSNEVYIILILLTIFLLLIIIELVIVKIEILILVIVKIIILLLLI